MEESTQQCEQGIVAWEVLYDQDEVKTTNTKLSIHFTRTIEQPYCFCC